MNSRNVPLSYTVTWTAKTVSHANDDETLYDFGLNDKCNETPQTIAFPTTQICYSFGKKFLYLQWNITDGSTKSGAMDTEFGPTPTVTIITPSKTKQKGMAQFVLTIGGQLTLKKLTSITISIFHTITGSQNTNAYAQLSESVPTKNQIVKALPLLV